MVCTLTGVKHLHHKAVEFDIGIYFEANGHGTVLFSERALNTFQMAAEDGALSDGVRDAGRQLCALTKLINQTVGDAISDLLLVEVVLLHQGVNLLSELYYEMVDCNDIHSGGVWSGMGSIRNYPVGS